MSDILTVRTERINAYLQHDLTNTTQRMEWEFAYFSANLHNLLPHIPKHDYLPIFNRLQANRMLSDLDIEQAGAMDVQGWDDNWVRGLREHPGIVCTFHTGSYRFLNLLLAKAGIPISLVVAGRALQAELEAFEKRYAPAIGQLGLRPDVEFIDAELPHSLIRMARAAKQGRCLLVYLDGNTGAKADDEKISNLLTVLFCAGRMLARKGTATLAYRLHLPIYPIICKRTSPQFSPETSHRLFYGQMNAILPHPEENEPAYVARATTYLYALLAQVASHCPHEWEGWLNIHFDVVHEAPPAPKRAFQAIEWVTYRWGKHPYILHLPSYTSYRLTWAEYRHYWRILNNEYIKGD